MKYYVVRHAHPGSKVPIYINHRKTYAIRYMRYLRRQGPWGDLEIVEVEIEGRVIASSPDRDYKRRLAAVQAARLAAGE